MKVLFRTSLISVYFILSLFYQLLLPECLVLLVTLKILDNKPKEGENQSLQELVNCKRKPDIRRCQYMIIFTGQNKTITFHSLHSYQYFFFVIIINIL